MLRSIETNLVRVNAVVISMYGSIIDFKAEVNSRISSLREELNAVNDLVSNLSMGLQEHEKQTKTELARLQTSLASTQVNHTLLLNIKIDH